MYNYINYNDAWRVNGIKYSVINDYRSNYGFIGFHFYTNDGYRYDLGLDTEDNTHKGAILSQCFNTAQPNVPIWRYYIQ